MHLEFQLAGVLAAAGTVPAAFQGATAIGRAMALAQVSGRERRKYARHLGRNSIDLHHEDCQELDRNDEF